MFHALSGQMVLSDDTILRQNILRIFYIQSALQEHGILKLPLLLKVLFKHLLNVKQPIMLENRSILRSYIMCGNLEN